ncbi:pectinacetylesterase [Leptospira langatensis]|uniref:Pectinacetylesterase n=1 Tax=Leptospira langatensis TaxID=2484983 RepID=A0A5F1ZV53_9LEPT|nr:pectin acetylesterase-family hydrolase [Leptospira langatensis]TGK00286.1 pectinacetylesterase [Leptospira langatensis]TGL41078.1 pectinacetylesterase [Leptospira langatensis]
MFRFLIVLIFFSSILCTKSSNHSDNEAAMNAAILGLVVSPYHRITPHPDTFTTQVDHGSGTPYTYTASFTPECSGTPGNTNFYFFRKTVRNANTKLLINFMGGGACWDDANCFGDNTTTYFNQLNTIPDFAINLIFKGIMDQSVGANPFRNYDIIFIPYCTGDLHIGSKVTTYARGTIQHHGYDNVISVLKFIQSAYSNLEEVFVIGQSAGGYGTILNFPIIRETVTSISSGVQVRMLSDASNAVVPTSSYTPGPAFFPVLENSWGVENGIGNASGHFTFSNLPQWVSGIGSTYTTSAGASLNDYFKKVADEYPNDRLAQYAAVFDGNQRFFYNVMGQINKINASQLAYTTATVADPYQSGKSYSSIFGDSDGSSMPDGNGSSSNDYTTCDWSKQAISKMKDAATKSNYRYYLGPGDVHTISTSNDMYSLVSGTVNFGTWLSDFAIGSMPTSVQCNDSAASCVNTNLITSTINTTLGEATSDTSYAISPKQNLFTTCGGVAGLGL